MLKRYWFIVSPQDRYGACNVGVTASTLNEARQLIKNTFDKINWTHISGREIDEAEVIENINIKLLDAGHVIPNMGVVTFKGVWFPCLNFQG